MWIRQRRQPQRLRPLPASWRRSGRLLFWFTLLRFWQQEPWLMSAAVLSVPGWLVRCAWCFVQRF